MTSLKVESRAFEAMLAWCRAEYPREACGLLGGRDGWAISHYPVANVAADPELRFEMDPKGQVDAFRALEANSEELVAIYHSHPRTSPTPSRADIEQAYFSHALYVIVGLAGARPAVRAYRLDRERGRAVEVRWMRVGARR